MESIKRHEAPASKSHSKRENDFVHFQSCKPKCASHELPQRVGLGVCVNWSFVCKIWLMYAYVYWVRFVCFLGRRTPTMLYSMLGGRSNTTMLAHFNCMIWFSGCSDSSGFIMLFAEPNRNSRSSQTPTPEVLRQLSALPLRAYQIDADRPSVVELVDWPGLRSRLGRLHGWCIIGIDRFNQLPVWMFLAAVMLLKLQDMAAVLSTISIGFARKRRRHKKWSVAAKTVLSCCFCY